MCATPTFSLIVPTRRRLASLRRFVDSVVATVADTKLIEIVLVVDSDDAESCAFDDQRIACRRSIGSPGRTMGALNQAGYEASTGRYVMLLNDDVVVRTRGWDATLARTLDEYPDGVVLGHVNDTLMRDHLCTFPVLSRTFCELADGLCPTDYTRYRIDDHIEDVFNRLFALGHQRAVYFPEVVFEHQNGVVMPEGHREYHADPAGLAVDAPIFERHAAARMRLVRRLLTQLGDACVSEPSLALLEQAADPFALRVPGRQRIVGRMPAARIGYLRRLRTCWQQRGWKGLAGALLRRVCSVTPLVPGTPPG